MINYKYRRLPVIIEAFQMTKERRKSNVDWPVWMHKAWQKNSDEVGSLGCENFPESDGSDLLVIHTLEGHHLVNWGDYIIRGVHDELYPCKPEIFKKTYEEV